MSCDVRTMGNTDLKGSGFSEKMGIKQTFRLSWCGQTETEQGRERETEVGREGKGGNSHKFQATVG